MGAFENFVDNEKTFGGAVPRGHWRHWTPCEVADYLKTTQFHRCAKSFEQQAIQGPMLPLLEESHLELLGLQTIGDRLTFRAMIKAVRDHYGDDNWDSAAEAAQRRRHAAKALTAADEPS